MDARPPLPLKVVHQVIQLQFLQPADNFERLRTSAQRLTEPAVLVLNQVQSGLGQVVLQSKSNSTTVVFRAGHCIMQTQFFGEFAKKEANQQRLEYAQSRFGALLALMSEAKIQPLYCDVATVAHMSGKGADYRHEQLVRAAAKSFQLRGPLSENQEPFDFLLRVSRVIDPDYFSSIWLAMYQERVFELIQPPGSVPPQPMVMFDWQGALMDEGLELRYERNNKRALWAGRVETGTEFAMKLVTSGISGFPTALDVVERALLENL